MITVLRFMTPCNLVSTLGIKVSEKHATCIFSVPSISRAGDDGNNNSTPKPLMSNYPATLQHLTEDTHLNIDHPGSFDSHNNMHSSIWAAGFS